MSQEINKKKLRLTANAFDLDTKQQNKISDSNPIITNNSNYYPNYSNVYMSQPYNASNLNPQYYQQQEQNINYSYPNQNQQSQDISQKKKKKKKAPKPKMDDESRKQFVLGKNQEHSTNLSSMLPIGPQKKKVTKSSSDEELKFDPKYGYWIYSHDEYLRLVQKQKDKEVRKNEKQIKLKDDQEKEQKKLEIKLQHEHEKQIEKRKKRRNLLGLARIGKIIFDLRQSRGVLNQKSAKKQYKFQVDIEGEINIVEKIKKKKLSKIKLAKKAYLEDFNNDLQAFNVSLLKDVEDDYETIAELTENETHEIVHQDKQEKKQKQNKKEELENESQEENGQQDDENASINQEDDEEIINEEETKTPESGQISRLKQQQLAQICNNLEQNPICQVLYNKMKVRGWVNHMICKELDDTVLHFINNLSLMQAKKKVLEPKKFKKRIVAGFNEVKRTLTTSIQDKTAKMILFPINILENPLPDGSDQKVIELIGMCIEKKIPFINASNRSKFNRAFCGKFGSKISAISVINYQGQEEIFQQVMNLHAGLRAQYDGEYKFDLLKQML